MRRALLALFVAACTDDPEPIQIDPSDPMIGTWEAIDADGVAIAYRPLRIFHADGRYEDGTRPGLTWRRVASEYIRICGQLCLDERIAQDGGHMLVNGLRPSLGEWRFEGSEGPCGTSDTPYWFTVSTLTGSVEGSRTECVDMVRTPAPCEGARSISRRYGIEIHACIETPFVRFRLGDFLGVSGYRRIP